MLTNIERTLIYKKMNNNKSKFTPKQEKRMRKKYNRAAKRSWMPYYEHI